MEQKITTRIEFKMVKHQQFSAKDMGDYELYFYSLEQLPDNVVVDRFFHQTDHASCFAAFLERSNLLDLADKPVLVFESTGLQPDNSLVRRHLGKARSVFRQIHDPSLEVLQAVGQSIENEYVAGAILRMSIPCLKSNSEALFGITNSILLLPHDIDHDYEHVCRQLLAICINQKTDRIRKKIPKFLESAVRLKMKGIGYGFGSEDFGGYFFDTFQSGDSSTAHNFPISH